MEIQNAISVKEIIGSVFTINALKTIFISIGTVFIYIFDNNPSNFYLLLGLICFDTITGVFLAIKNKNIYSRGFLRVAYKSCVYLILIMTGHLFDKIIGFHLAGYVMELFLAATECISILENAGRLGWPVPTKLLEKLKAMKDDQ